MPNASRKRRSPSADDDSEPQGPAKKMKQGMTTNVKTPSATVQDTAKGEVHWEVGQVAMVSADGSGLIQHASSGQFMAKR